MTSAEPGEPLAVYLGAAGELVAPDGSPSSSSSSISISSGRSSTRSFHESRAGGSACAPSSPACVGGGGAASNCAPPDPPLGLALPPPCGSCGAATALVMQIHAPLLPSLPDRALLFFACVSEGDMCSRKQEAWVGVRVQGPRAAEPCPPSSPPEEEEAAAPSLAPVLPPPAPVVAADSWGLDEDASGAGEWGIDGGDEDPKKTMKNEKREKVDFSQLGAELSSAAEALSISGSSSKPKVTKHQRERGGGGRGGGGGGRGGGGGGGRRGEDATKGDQKKGGEGEGEPPARLWMQPGESGPTLPSFYVSWAPEEEEASVAASASARRKSKVCWDLESSIDDAHVAELLAKYEASERGGGSGSTAAASSSSSSSAAAASSSAAASTTAEAAEALSSSKLADSAGWSGEAYEPDSTPGASAAFLAFAKKVARSPRQVARYHCRPRLSAAAPAPSPSLLWPEARGPPAPPPPCPRCGSAREYEAQLMAPLVALIDEAGQWEEEEEAGGEEEEEEQEGGGGKGAEHQQQQRQRQRRLRRRRGKPTLGRAPESWEWLTVAMATCRAGCAGGREDDVVAFEEAVAVAFE